MVMAWLNRITPAISARNLTVSLQRGASPSPTRSYDSRPHISTRQYARIVRRWVERAGLANSAYGTHSLRRTKAAQICKKTGNLRAVQLLLGHTKLESTVRYLGIEVDDALSISEQVESLIQRKCGPVSGGAAISSFRRNFLLFGGLIC